MSPREPSETAITASAPSSATRSQTARQRVAAAELLGLPRPQRLERVHGRDVRDVVGQLRQVAGEVARTTCGCGRGRRPPPRPPSSGRSTSPAAPRDAAPCRPARPTGGARRRRGASRSAPHAWTVRSTSRSSSRAEVLDVDARPAVDLRRVLAREQGDLHGSTTSPLPTTTTPPCETVKRSLSRSEVDAELRARVDVDVLVDDRALHDRAAADLDAGHDHRVLHRRVGVDVRARREHRAAHLAARDDHAGAHHRVQRVARAVLVGEHELGRRQRVVPGEDRPLAVVEVEHRGRSR